MNLRCRRSRNIEIKLENNQYIGASYSLQAGSSLTLVLEFSLVCKPCDKVSKYCL